MIDLCSIHDQAASYVLGIAIKVDRKKRVTLCFKRYAELCDARNGKTQMALWWPKGQHGQRGKELLKLKPPAEL